MMIIIEEKVREINLPEESLIIKQVQNGNTQAYKQLYDKYVKKIFALCYRMVADITIAEDLTQEIFLRAWKKIGTFQFKSSFYTWLYRLAVHVIFRKKSKIKNKQKKEVTDEIETVYKNQEMGDMSHIDLMIDYERALHLLPEQARKIFILHEIEGLKHEEIKELTGISVGTSKAHLSRARKMLIKELKG